MKHGESVPKGEDDSLGPPARRRIRICSPRTTRMKKSERKRSKGSTGRRQIRLPTTMGVLAKVGRLGCRRSASKPDSSR